MQRAAVVAWMLAGCASATGPSVPATDARADTSATSDVVTGPCATSVTCPRATVAVQKACTQDSDCTVVRHITDCCGSVEQIGVRADSETAFTVNEQACVMGSVCDCLGQDTIESGESTSQGDAALAVCQAGCCIARLARH